MLHLPRRASCTKFCACHVDAAGPQRRPSARRQSRESQSAAPATQEWVQMHQMLPHKWSRAPAAHKRVPAMPRISKCRTCHAKIRPCARSAARATQVSPDAPNAAPANLPRKTTSVCTKCCTCHCTCHVNVAGPQAPKRAPAIPRESKRRTCYAELGRGAQSVSPATQKQPGLSGDQARAGNPQRVKVLHLPGKSSSRCTKCCACVR